jgi:murein DD-endopeptidase MepM/ murein hydrolase activator NlpD
VLARVVNSPIVAANRGKVVHASPLGIYGNCVILDHGIGVQSLYAHLSSISVKVGDMVEKEKELGKSGMTGLAGGDHLHFTMLVSGQMVNPVGWWDPHWIQDRIIRKLREASGSYDWGRAGLHESGQTWEAAPAEAASFLFLGAEAADLPERTSPAAPPYTRRHPTPLLSC